MQHAPELGWEEIDSQHRSLVDSFAFLRKAPRRRDSDLAELRRILSEMRSHFDWEEGAMSDCAYPDRAKHGADHRRQFENISDLCKLVQEGHEVIDLSFFDACMTWNHRHIESMDADFVQYRNEREIWDLRRELEEWDIAERFAVQAV